MPPKPLALSDAELSAIFDAATPLAVEVRSEFVRAVAAVLATSPRSAPAWSFARAPRCSGNISARPISAARRAHQNIAKNANVVTDAMRGACLASLHRCIDRFAGRRRMCRAILVASPTALAFGLETAKNKEARGNP